MSTTTSGQAPTWPTQDPAEISGSVAATPIYDGLLDSFPSLAPLVRAERARPVPAGP